MIGVDPHKGSHTAVVIDQAEMALGEVRVRASASQVRQLLEWAAAWAERTWAVEGAGGLGHLLDWQLVAAGERVLDVQPELAARVRLLAAGDVSKNDPDDARSVAIAALRSAACPPVRADDHAAVLKVRAKRHRDLSRSATRSRVPAARGAAGWFPAVSASRSTRQPPPASSIRSSRPQRSRRPDASWRAVPGRPAPPRRPAPRHQEGGRGDPGPGHHRDRGLRRRPGRGRRGERRCPRHLPVPRPGLLRRRHRHRRRPGAGRVVLPGVPVGQVRAALEPLVRAGRRGRDSDRDSPLSPGAWRLRTRASRSVPGCSCSESAQFYRYRRVSTLAERQQTTWVVWLRTTLTTPRSGR